MILRKKKTEDFHCNANYLGGEPHFPKPMKTEIRLTKTILEIPKMKLEIPYASIMSVDNEEKSIKSKMHLMGLKYVPATIIRYYTTTGMQETLVFECKGSMASAQGMIYDRMLSVKSEKTESDSEKLVAEAEKTAPLYDIARVVDLVSEKIDSRLRSFDANYLGGNTSYPKPFKTEMTIFENKIRIKEIDLDIPYSAILDIKIENVSQTILSSEMERHRRRLGSYGPLAKKKRFLVISITYNDKSVRQTSMIFKYKGKIKDAQSIIYQKMMESRRKADELTRQDTLEQEYSFDDSKLE